MKALFISAALLAPAFAVAAPADDKTINEKQTDARPTNAKKANDRSYDEMAAKSDLSQSELLNKLHQVNVGHTELGNLAQTHAKSPKVMKLGERMAKEFTRVDQRVIGYSKDNGIVLSDAVGMMKGAAKEQKGPKADWADLGKLQGEAFDRKFLTGTVEGCQRFITTLEGAKGQYDMAFDRLLDHAIDNFKTFEKEALELDKSYAPST
ncbi:MAG: DUF4142 domain-containing protein [Myxococcaceae bacterium]|nr:DUF4142 domain-containing protein [Myxococcaceae bacterium]